jgi:LAGLIDADG endonuclease
LSGKHQYLPRHLARDGREPAHIGETLLLLAEGNPEGSPSDPLTTDPKGEARRAPARPEIYATCNTPALIARQGAYEAAVPLEPWYVTGLTDGEGCFCISLAIRPKLRVGLEVRPSFSLSLNERDRDLLEALRAFFCCGWIRESKRDRTFKFEVRSISDLVVYVLPHFERFPSGGARREAVQASVGHAR